MARLGVSVDGRVRKSRAGGDHLARALKGKGRTPAVNTNLAALLADKGQGQTTTPLSMNLNLSQPQLAPHLENGASEAETF